MIVVPPFKSEPSKVSMYAFLVTALGKLHDKNSLRIFQRQTVLESNKVFQQAFTVTIFHYVLTSVGKTTQEN